MDMTGNSIDVIMNVRSLFTDGGSVSQYTKSLTETVDKMGRAIRESTVTHVGASVRLVTGAVRESSNELMKLVQDMSREIDESGLILPFGAGKKAKDKFRAYATEIETLTKKIVEGIGDQNENYNQLRTTVQKLNLELPKLAAALRSSAELRGMIVTGIATAGFAATNYIKSAVDSAAELNLEMTRQSILAKDFGKSIASSSREMVGLIASTRAYKNEIIGLSERLVAANLNLGEHRDEVMETLLQFERLGRISPNLGARLAHALTIQGIEARNLPEELRKIMSGFLELRRVGGPLVTLEQVVGEFLANQDVYLRLMRTMGVGRREAREVSVDAAFIAQAFTQLIRRHMPGTQFDAAAIVEALMQPTTPRAQKLYQLVGYTGSFEQLEALIKRGDIRPVADTLVKIGAELAKLRDIKELDPNRYRGVVEALDRIYGDTIKDFRGLLKLFTDQGEELQKALTNSVNQVLAARREVEGFNEAWERFSSTFAEQRRFWGALMESVKDTTGLNLVPKLEKVTSTINNFVAGLVTLAGGGGLEGFKMPATQAAELEAFKTGVGRLSVPVTALATVSMAAALNMILASGPVRRLYKSIGESISDYYKRVRGIRTEPYTIVDASGRPIDPAQMYATGVGLGGALRGYLSRMRRTGFRGYLRQAASTIKGIPGAVKRRPFMAAGYTAAALAGALSSATAEDEQIGFIDKLLNHFLHAVYAGAAASFVVPYSGVPVGVTYFAAASLYESFKRISKSLERKGPFGEFAEGWTVRRQGERDEAERLKRAIESGEIGIEKVAASAIGRAAAFAVGRMVRKEGVDPSKLRIEDVLSHPHVLSQQKFFEEEIEKFIKAKYKLPFQVSFEKRLWTRFEDIPEDPAKRTKKFMFAGLSPEEITAFEELYQLIRETREEVMGRVAKELVVARTGGRLLVPPDEPVAPEQHIPQLPDLFASPALVVSAIDKQTATTGQKLDIINSSVNEVNDSIRKMTNMLSGLTISNPGREGGSGFSPSAGRGRSNFSQNMNIGYP